MHRINNGRNRQTKFFDISDSTDNRSLNIYKSIYRSSKYQTIKPNSQTLLSQLGNHLSDVSKTETNKTKSAEEKGKC